MKNKYQTTNNKQQTTNNKRQTTNNKQQTTNNKQPIYKLRSNFSKSPELSFLTSSVKSSQGCN
ncbi:MAG TPA: hypothetical protein DCL61_33120 [Cyanobacteria bacterium UBA12227]|nr:hypothetical protein [Cyanobacteria bacterium UBA12227]